MSEARRLALMQQSEGEPSPGAHEPCAPVSSGRLPSERRSCACSALSASAGPARRDGRQLLGINGSPDSFTSLLRAPDDIGGQLERGWARPIAGRFAPVQLGRLTGQIRGASSQLRRSARSHRQAERAGVPGQQLPVLRARAGEPARLECRRASCSNRPLSCGDVGGQLQPARAFRRSSPAAPVPWPGRSADPGRPVCPGQAYATSSPYAACWPGRAAAVRAQALAGPIPEGSELERWPWPCLDPRLDPGHRPCLHPAQTLSLDPGQTLLLPARPGRWSWSCWPGQPELLAGAQAQGQAAWARSALSHGQPGAGPILGAMPPCLAARPILRVPALAFERPASWPAEGRGRLLLGAGPSPGACSPGRADRQLSSALSACSGAEAARARLPGWAARRACLLQSFREVDTSCRVVSNAKATRFDSPPKNPEDQHA
jgi:hypothetical protein